MKVLIPAKWGNSPLENVDIFLSTILFAPSKPYSFARATSVSHPFKDNFDSFTIVKPENEKKGTNILYELEKKIIEILLLYGNNVEDFEDLILKEDENGKLALSPINRQAKDFEKIIGKQVISSIKKGQQLTKESIKI